jgi:sugar lactone lactonase YvrE
MRWGNAVLALSISWCAACGRFGFAEPASADTAEGTSIDAPVEQLLYWVDGGQAIRRMHADGSGVELVVTTPAFCLAVDPVHQQLYWSTTSSIMRANYDGTGSAVVGTGSQLYSVVVDAAAGYVYWAAYMTGIFRADLDGANAINLNAPGSGWRDLALSADHTRLYYSGVIGADRVSYLSTTGSEPGGDVFAVASAGIINPELIEVDERGRLYWANTQAGSEKIQRVNVDGSQPLDLVTLPAPVTSFGGLAYHAASQRIFWSNGGTEVLSVSVDGGPYSSIAFGAGAPGDLLFIDAR